MANWRPQPSEQEIDSRAVLEELRGPAEKENQTQQTQQTQQSSEHEVESKAAIEELMSAAEKETEKLPGGLTEAQEEALYNEGAIPRPGFTQEEMEAEPFLALLDQAGIAPPPDGFEDVEVETAPRPTPVATHKFPLPQLPLPPHSHLKQRYHPVLDQLTNLMMRDGKKSLAQRNMAMVLNFLRTSPPPIINPKYPLLPNAPPPAHLPLNPVLYLTLAVDSVAPLVQIRRIAGGAGGGRPLELPQPLRVRQRRRAAFQWILDVVNKKPSKGSGRTQFAHRLSEEIIAVVEGRSPVWEKRLALHKLGTASRANLTAKPVKGGK
ncbi:37S ribosomal protein S7 [Colletotrichum spinosum]|uniref:Small ribosomal subunit protein uS7m n=1 Tax=Colletotrichum spinosum TaxID=1347390 RepID=A0A4V3HTE8_9PEZI|nr:37S ribosomal protein S7 [Colletotrichum spinosum]